MFIQNSVSESRARVPLEMITNLSAMDFFLTETKYSAVQTLSVVCLHANYDVRPSTVIAYMTNDA